MTAKGVAVATILACALAVAAAPRPLTVTCPPAVSTATAPGASTAFITYSPAVTAGGTGAVTVTYSQDSGTDFAVGATPVSVRAADASGAAVSCSIPITVTATPCTFTLSATSAGLPATGGSTTVTVTAVASTCAWTASSSAPWLTLSAQAGTGSGSVTITAAPNVGTTALTGTVTIGGQTFTVTQAAPTPSATLVATATSVQAGQAVTLTLTTPTWNYHNVKINGVYMQVVQGQCLATGCVFQLTVTPTATTTYQSSADQPTGVPYPNMPAVTVTVAAPPPPPPPTTLPAGTLLQASNLVEVGTFSMPNTTDTWNGQTLYEFQYANGQIAFNPASNSLFVVGHDWAQRTAEVSIPAMGGTSTVLQPFTDATAGKLSLIEPNSGTTNKIGGMFVTGGKLLVTGFVYYDGNGGAVASQFTRSTTLSDTNVAGPFKVGTMNPGFVAGFFTAVPTAWQAALGGDLIVSQCCLSIITRTSFGPDAFVMKTADALAATSSIAATPLLYYDQYHTTLGGWQPPTGTTDPTFNGTTAVKGSVIVPGTNSLLFFGVTGTGTFCYGEGTSDQSLNNQPVPGEPNVVYCYDPTSSAKGQHAYPYTGYVWAYNLADLAAVKAGTKNPWDVVPYATWPMAFNAVGATYDAATGRLFLSGYGPNGLIIHQLKIQ